MEKQTLSKLFSGKVFRIPDYQRGYSWDEKQWKDLVEDIDALVSDEQVKSHYTGTIVTYSPKNSQEVYNRKTVDVVDVVDGQQRLTSIILYLSVIIRVLVKEGEKEYAQDVPEFLFHDATARLTLNNDTADLFYQLLKTGTPRTEVTTSHQKRLARAVDYFHSHIHPEPITPLSKQDIERIKQLFAAITGNLVFTYYTIEEECEIGMTFELMNSRGKGLSVLELLKNYLMHWVARNGEDNERKSLTDIVNTAWKDIYINVGNSNGTDEQCLRVAWTLHCHHLPKNWKGYDGFKDEQYIPLRNFTQKSKEDTKAFLLDFTNGLAKVSQHYGIVVSPTDKNIQTSDELEWLSKIHNTGNFANFLPLMVAARMQLLAGEIEETEYSLLLKAIECYSYRVFLVEGKRSNAGKSSFYRWGKELFQGSCSVSEITSRVYSVIHYYSPEENFQEEIKKPSSWYHRRHLLKYTLFEYEKHRLDSKNKGQKPLITWNDLAKESTLEHILPQNPEPDSHWLTVWSEKDMSTYLHDIGNIVLTRDNSSYSNFEYERKKGKVGEGVCYSNSDIRQEREIAANDDWSVEELKKRRKLITDWIFERWKTVEAINTEVIDEVEDEDIAVVDDGYQAGVL